MHYSIRNAERTTVFTDPQATDSTNRLLISQENPKKTRKTQRVAHTHLAATTAPTKKISFRPA